MITRPVILGYDAVSPLGTDLEAQWQRAAAGESGVGRADPLSPAGGISRPDRRPGCRNRHRPLSVSPAPRDGPLDLARLQTRPARRPCAPLKRAGLEITPEMAPRVAVTFSSAIGGLDALIDADRTLVATGKLPQPFMNPNSCINMVGGKVAIVTGATGPIPRSSPPAPRGAVP